MNLDQHNSLAYFAKGFKNLMPLATGVIPFGLIMGTVSAEAGLNFIESMGLNLIVFAGASQLVAIELMNNGTPTLMVLLTCLTVNLRLLMYSTSLAPIMTELSALKKIGLAYIITDQAYAVSISEFDNIPQWRNKVFLYMGAGIGLFVVWQISVIIGLFFGDIAPKSLSLEFAVPLAFMSIVIPSLKSKTLIIVAASSSLFSILFHHLPLNLGLISSALCALIVGIVVDKPKDKKNG